MGYMKKWISIYPLYAQVHNTGIYPYISWYILHCVLVHNAGYMQCILYKIQLS